MGEFTRVAVVGDLPDPGYELMEIADRMVVLFHIEGKYYCLDDVCTHDGGPLSDGCLDGKSIVCPRHGAKFDICTGKALTMPATEDTLSHEVKIEGDEVFVRLRD